MNDEECRPVLGRPEAAAAPPLKWTTELVLFAIVMITLFFVCDLVWDLGDKFVRAKIKNDSQIAADTKRIADVLEAASPMIITGGAAGRQLPRKISMKFERVK